jgi:hypothetical protein
MNGIPQSAANISTERWYLLAGLSGSRDRVLEVLLDTPEELSRVRPSSDCWSILECAEHMAVAERLMFHSLERRTPTDAAPDRSKDALIEIMGKDRSHKRSSPERARPAGKFATIKDALADFCEARERTIAFVKHSNEDFRKSQAVHLLGTFDSHQFLLIMVVHTQRHVLQIEEIQNSAPYRAALSGRQKH